jgi:hypothetical protein
MSGEIEAAGAIATAGAVAGVIEGREGGPPGEGDCANCGAKLTGPFCAACGQHAYPRRKLIHVIGELAHGIFYLETKTWRTLPMVLFRPGTLTRNYVYGKRARYLSPLTMFLFAIFIMFFAFSTIEAPMNVRDNEVTVTQEQLTEARQELEQAEAELARARANPDPDEPAGLEVGLAEGAVNIAQAQVDMLERQLAEAQVRQAQRAREQAEDAPVTVNVNRGDEPATTTAPAAETPATTDTATPDAPAADAPATTPEETQYETWQDGMREIGESEDFVVFGGADQDLNERVRRKFQNPDLALYQIQDAASKFSFLLAPIVVAVHRAALPLEARRDALRSYGLRALLRWPSCSLAVLSRFRCCSGRRLSWLGQCIGGLLVAGLPVHMWFHLQRRYTPLAGGRRRGARSSCWRFSRNSSLQHIRVGGRDRRIGGLRWLVWTPFVLELLELGGSAAVVLLMVGVAALLGFSHLGASSMTSDLARLAAGRRRKRAARNYRRQWPNARSRS